MTTSDQTQPNSAPNSDSNLNAHLPETAAHASRLGAHPVPGGGTRFRVWTTTAQQVEVRVDGQIYPMPAQGNGFFETELPVGADSRYIFLLDGVPRPDPYAQFLPDGVHGEAEVVNVEEHEWVNTNWRGLKLEDCVFYELHVGTFTPEGTYRAAQERLPYLAELGITAIELMPIAAFPGERGWGYDGVALYSPYAPYGRPEELKSFIDAAHGLGLAVILDVVYNHFGPDGAYLAVYAPSYFTDRFSSPWGAGLDYAEVHMRRYITGNARMWLRDYHFDGLRLDATQAMQDDSEVHILQELAQEVHKLGGTHLLLAEDYRNLPELVTEYHLDGIWVDDFHHEVRVTLTGDQDGYYSAYRGGAAALAHVINRGWVFEGQYWAEENRPRGKKADALDASNFVYFIQNHDQVGNRAIGDRVHHLDRVSDGAFRGASMLLLTLPMTPLLFQGQEWASSAPFPFFSDHHGELGAAVSEGRKREFGTFESFSSQEILDPQAKGTHLKAKLNWQEAQEGEHARTLALYRDLLWLRREDPVLRQRLRRNIQAGNEGDVVWVRHQTDAGTRLLLWNTGREEADLATLNLNLPAEVIRHSEGRSKFDPSDAAALRPGEAVLLGGQA
ncbi:malto-oligosyltrehalose trehalohydrolase [Deinococcus sp. QL22]|uniref:malto-oligosyltrehalose trehalohydrolase n=1 Tax=Deinococcus sp. QL22 TaxID=2939437 RepID=UPI00201814D8|nr:malto-oligosyltrehalose trehalohydrolase [Deinococcus sp. QL22]UQN05356.1 malto-oligosyltrehalose trehalohydrolase [Deinococcus sp. QL22]